MNNGIYGRKCIIRLEGLPNPLHLFSQEELKQIRKKGTLYETYSDDWGGGSAVDYEGKILDVYRHHFLVEITHGMIVMGDIDNVRLL